MPHKIQKNKILNLFITKGHELYQIFFDWSEQSRAKNATALLLGDNFVLDFLCAGTKEEWIDGRSIRKIRSSITRNQWNTTYVKNTYLELLLRYVFFLRPVICGYINTSWDKRQLLGGHMFFQLRKEKSQKESHHCKETISDSLIVSTFPPPHCLHTIVPCTCTGSIRGGGIRYGLRNESRLRQRTLRGK